MKAYSLDFRQKIVQTYENEKISQVKLAKRFNVAKSFVQTLLKQWRETGDLNPKPQGGHKKLKVSPPQLIIIGDWLEEKNDLTLQAIQQRLESQENTKVSISTVWRVLHHLNLTRKKKHSMPVNVTRKECNSRD